MPPGAVAARLIRDPCFNIAASAAIMRVCLNESHGNLLAAVGRYHAHRPGLSTDYREKVLGAALTLFARQFRPKGQ